MAKSKAKKAGGAKADSAPAAGDLGVLKGLLALLDGSSATTIKFQRGDASYEVSRGGPTAAMAPAHPVAGALHPAAQVPPGAPVAEAARPAAVAPPSQQLEIKSPMVGTFYRSPEPGAEPYAKVGMRVTPGQTLCIIEAMKIMNEIESEVTGVIREILVEEAQPVEFGQVLFRVDPHG